MPSFNLSSEDNLAQRYASDIQTFWQAKVTQGQFTANDGIKIAYASAINPNAYQTIVICTGRIEGLVKYKEVVFDLYNNGYSVFIHDHRGQGFSDRLLSNPHKGYVDSFDDYVNDFRHFMRSHVLPHTDQKGYQKPHLLCHSMGGAIGTLYLLEYATDFDKVALSAPMFGIAAPIPSFISRLIITLGATLNKLFKSEPWYFLGLGDYSPVEFEKNALTQSMIRYDLFRKEYEGSPSAQLGGPTFHWLQQAVIAMNKIECNAHNILHDCLVLKAGKDNVVDNRQQQTVVEHMSQAKLIVINDAKHELLLESDQFRLPSMESILSHFSNS